METYKIIRFRRKSGRQSVIRRGLSLEDARAHCSREDTHKRDKYNNVIWFDGFTKE